MAIQNENLIQYQLLPTLGEADRYWLDLNTLKTIDLATVTDDDIDFLVLQYPDWAGIVVEEATEGFLILGGPIYKNGDTPILTRRNGAPYEPIFVRLLPTVTPNDGSLMYKIGFLLQYNSEDFSGIMDEINIEGLGDLTYISGFLPTYCTKLDISEAGLDTFDMYFLLPGLRNINLSGNRLSQQGIEKVITACDESGAKDGTLNLTGANMAAPSNKVATAIDSLISKGWQIDTE